MSSAKWSPVRLSYQRGDITHVYLSPKFRLRPWQGRLIPGVTLINRVAERVGRNKGLLILPVLVIRRSEQDADPEVDIDQIRGD